MSERKGWLSSMFGGPNAVAALEREQKDLEDLQQRIEHLASKYPDRSWLLNAHRNTTDGVSHLQVLIMDAEKDQSYEGRSDSRPLDAKTVPGAHSVYSGR